MVAKEPENKPLHIPSTARPLPPGWTWWRLDDVCTGIFDCPHSTPSLTQSGPFVARSQDIRTGVFRADEAAHVSEETYVERIKRAEPRHGDLLYSREGTYFGIAAEVPAETKVCLGQRMVLLRPDPARIHFRFLRYWLNSPILAAHVHGHRDGTVAERLNLPTIRGLPVPVPPLEEQKLIAHILGALDDKVELNRRMNETLEAIARALFKSWFVDFDPARAEGRAPEGIDAETAALFTNSFVDSELGEIPQGWNVGALEDIADIVMGQSPPGETYNEQGEGMPFYQGVRDFGFRFPSRRVFCTSPTRLAQKGDALLSVRAPVGSLNMAIEPCAIGRGVAALRLRTQPSGFLYYILRSTQARWQNFEAQGTVFGSASKQDVRSFEIIIPPVKLIHEYGCFVEPLDKRIELNTQESQTLVAIRDALLPKLMSGEIRVNP